MMGTGFWWVLLAGGLYGLLHSIVASHHAKALAERLVGLAITRRYYRLFFVIMAIVTLLPILILLALLPDQTIYTIPTPWVYLTLPLQALAAVAILIGVRQTGTLNFLGISQWLEYNPQTSQPRPEKMQVGGLYRWVRHPLYTFSFVLLWLMPVMTWNLLAINLSLSLYMLIGAIFEERKLVEQFGSAYEEYRQRTPMIIPGVKLRR